jgi:DNA-binding NtrC family response regulator
MMRVLIVDDEAPLRRLLQNWVEAQGADVIEAGTAEEGLSLVETGGAPAVALCDIRLPGKDGLWLAEQLHARFPETVVLMTTGVLEFGAAVHSLQAGVVDYLVKPFKRERLAEAVNLVRCCTTSVAWRCRTRF